MKTTIIVISSAILFFTFSSMIEISDYSNEEFKSIDSEYEYLENADPLSMIIVGTVIIVKKASTSKAVSIGIGYGRTFFGLTGAALTTENIYKRLQNQNQLRLLNALLEMTDDDLYRYCHQLGGGMASTLDIRQDQWGEKYIFGVPRPYGTAYYAGAVCVST